MSVLVDTPIWSLALRRPSARLSAQELRRVEEWKRLVSDGRARIAGIIRQEVLSGIRDAADFERLRERLAAFDDVPARSADHETAASYFNACRAKGVAASSFDALICALAARHDLSVFTTDADFSRYAAVLPIRLYQLTASA
jgi:predicted nucleic acid-binding protein